MLKIKSGGLKRCCVGTLERNAPELKDAKEGNKIVCEHCLEPMIFRNGYWRWDCPRP